MTARVRRLVPLYLLALLLIIVAPPLGTPPAWAQADDGEDAVSPEGETDGDGDAESAEGEVDDAADQADETPDEEGGDEDEDDAADQADQSFGDALGVTILGASSVAGAILFFVQSGDSQDLADDAGRIGDLDRQNELQDRSDREQAVGITLTVLGAGLLGVATWLWIDRARERRGSESTVTFVPSFHPDGGASFVLGGRF